MITRVVLSVCGRCISAIAFIFVGKHRFAESMRNAVSSVRHRALLDSLKSCGEGTSVQLPVCFTSPEEIEFGEYVSVAAYVHVWGAGGVRLGNRVMVGTHVSISSVTHDYGLSNMRQTVVTKPVSIEDDVWIGSNAVILPGVRIGRGAVVGAGAVVTRDVAPGSIVAGVPARELSMRPAGSF